MQVQPYLSFEGRCEEAIEFYKKALGAKVEMLMRFKDAAAGECAPGSEDKIMHAALKIGESTVMASDGRMQRKPAPGVCPFSRPEEQGRSRTHVSCAVRRRAGAGAARQDLFRLGLRHGRGPLRRALDGDRAGKAMTGKPMQSKKTAAVHGTFHHRAQAAAHR